MEFYADRDPAFDFPTVHCLILHGSEYMDSNISHRFCLVRRPDSGERPFTVDPISAVVRRRAVNALMDCTGEDRVRIDALTRAHWGLY